MEFEEPNITEPVRRIGTTTIICVFVVACLIHMNKIKICLMTYGQRNTRIMYETCMKYLKKYDVFESGNNVNHWVIISLCNDNIENKRSVYFISPDSINKTGYESFKSVNEPPGYDFVICDNVFDTDVHCISTFLYRCLRSKSLVYLFESYLFDPHSIESGVSIKLTELNTTYQDNIKSSYLVLLMMRRRRDCVINLLPRRLLMHLMQFIK
jgi:hypothetical protein